MNAHNLNLNLGVFCIRNIQLRYLSAGKRFRYSWCSTLFVTVNILKYYSFLKIVYALPLRLYRLFKKTPLFLLPSMVAVSSNYLSIVQIFVILCFLTSPYRLYGHFGAFFSVKKLMVSFLLFLTSTFCIHGPYRATRQAINVTANSFFMINTVNVNDNIPPILFIHYTPALKCYSLTFYPSNNAI